MNFCVITPTSGLERWATRSKSHMVLAQEYMRDDEYAHFYNQRRKAGDVVILDNGVYEGTYDPKTFLRAIKELKPTVAVLPDIICQGHESTARSAEFLLTHAGDYPGVEWMFIPQGRNIEEWHRSLRSVRTLFDHTPPIWVGLTRFLPSHTCKGDQMIRVKLAKLVRELYPNPPIHCMGMANGSLKELVVLAQQNIVCSIDSSAPVWRGWKGFWLDQVLDRQAWNKEGCDVDFSARFPSEIAQRRIEDNLEAVYGSIRI